MQKCKTKNNLLTPISFHIGTQTNQTNKRDKKNSKVFFKDLNIKVKILKNRPITKAMLFLKIIL